MDAQDVGSAPTDETVTWYQRGSQPLRLQGVYFTQIDPASSGPPVGFFQGASSMTPFAAALPNKS